jgi:hypothetical protein
VSLLIEALVVAGVVVVGRWIDRRMGARSAAKQRGGPPAPAPPPPSPPSQAPPSQAQAQARARARASLPSADAFAGFRCRLGDVIVRVAERDEAWLAGALLLEEQQPVAALFVAPEAGGDRAVFVRRAEDSGVTWLSPLSAGEVAPGAEPPHVIEHRGTLFERARRLPVRVVRVGSGAPAVGERAVVAEYRGPAVERLVVLAGSERQLAWRGVALAEGEFDVLPGGRGARDER